MTERQVHDGRLQRLYDRGPRVVAYLDETLRIGRTGEQDFYAVTAMLFDFEIAHEVRDTLLNIVGGDYWHTTDAYGSREGERVLRELVEYLAGDEALVMLCAVHAALSDFEADIERARRHCLEEIVRILAEDHDVDLVVYERRRAGAEEEADNDTMRGLRALHATRDIRLHGGTPYSEPLLWGPDVLASVLRRRLAVNDPVWFEPLRTKTVVYDARTGQQVILKKTTP